MKTRMILAVVVGLAASQPGWGAVNIQVQPTGLNYRTVLNSGPSAQKYDIVFIGDGFTSTQQVAFNTAVDDAVNALRNRAPFGDTMCGLNIWRVNVVSTDSGVDHPADNIFRNTELDCRYGNPANGEAERCVTSDSPAKCFEAAGFAPDYDAVFILVNDAQWGGCAGSLVFSSISPGFAGIITHELGHKIGALADEYDCYICNGTDDNRTYTGAEPGSVNLTKNTNRATTKWASLILPATPLPTTVDSPAGVVGLWAGGGYFRFGIFRPQFNCHMRSTGSEFCAVCRQKMRSDLAARCTFCQLNPNTIACRFADLFKRSLYKVDFTRLRWPIPPCLSCPFDVDLKLQSVLVLEGLPDGFALDIYDSRGNLVSTTDGPVRGGKVALQFETRADTQYFAEISTERQPNGQVMDLSAQLLRGQAEQELPSQ